MVKTDLKHTGQSKSNMHNRATSICVLQMSMSWLTDTRKLHHKAHVLQVLKSTAVRGYANTLAYYNQEYATKDAMNIGRLHTYLSGGSRLALQSRMCPWTLVQATLYGVAYTVVLQAVNINCYRTAC